MSLRSCRRSIRASKWTKRPGAMLLAVVATATTVPAPALAALPLRVPRLRLPPPVEIRIPAATQREIVAATEVATGFGTGISAVENRLDNASVEAVQAVSDDIARIGLTPAVRARLRECVASGMQTTAQEYGQAMVAQFLGAPSDFPGVYDSFQSAAYSCIGDQINIPDDVVEHVATYFSRRVHGYFETVATITANGPAQQRWLQLTAIEVAAAGTESDTGASPSAAQATPNPPPATMSGDSRGVLPWLGAAVLVLTIALIVWRPWRRREGT